MARRTTLKEKYPPDKAMMTSKLNQLFSLFSGLPSQFLRLIKNYANEKIHNSLLQSHQVSAYLTIL